MSCGDPTGCDDPMRHGLPAMLFPLETSSRFSSLCLVPRLHRCVACVERGRYSSQVSCAETYTSGCEGFELCSHKREHRPAANGRSGTADHRRACWMNIGSSSRHLSLSVASSHHGVSPGCSSSTLSGSGRPVLAQANDPCRCRGLWRSHGVHGLR